MRNRMAEFQVQGISQGNTRFGGIEISQERGTEAAQKSIHRNRAAPVVEKRAIEAGAHEAQPSMQQHAAGLHEANALKSQGLAGILGRRMRDDCQAT
jgi:hypothetical protein